MALKRRLDETASDIVESIRTPVEKSTGQPMLLSTGSTLLDLTISGGKYRGGGIPGGIIVEVFGPPSSGKTAILAEVCASAQSKGGDVEYVDPEARLDQEYSRIYGMELLKNKYHRPDTVTELFDLIKEWTPARTDVVNVLAADSLAAFSTELEMEDSDKMGMRRAKEFSEGLRKTARLISKDNRLIICSNQVRESAYGEVTPGGKGIPYYASLRLRIGPAKSNPQIEKNAVVNGKKIAKTIGVKSDCLVKKSSIDDPFRTCQVYIVFGYGVDDIRGNLQYIKDTMGLSKYLAVDKEYVSMNDAIGYIESNNYEGQLKESVIELWTEVETKFKIERKRKDR